MGVEGRHLQTACSLSPMCAQACRASLRACLQMPCRPASKRTCAVARACHRAGAKPWECCSGRGCCRVGERGADFAVHVACAFCGFSTQVRGGAGTVRPAGGLGHTAGLHAGQTGARTLHVLLCFSHSTLCAARGRGARACTHMTICGCQQDFGQQPGWGFAGAWFPPPPSFFLLCVRMRVCLWAGDICTRTHTITHARTHAHTHTHAYVSIQ